MNKLDTEKILKRTNNLIGYELYEREERIMKKKFKNTLVAVAAVLILSGGTFTVNAMTDNSIVNSVKNVFGIKVNGEEKNATCERTENGSLKCKVDESVLGNDKEAEFEFFNNSEENIKIEDNNDELTVNFE